LGKEQAWGLFRALLKELGVRLSSKEAPTFNQRMARLRHLAPGDFAVIRRKALMAGKRLGAGLLVGWLEQEAASKPINFKATIGFS
jgi:hypothetical protein